MSIILKNNLNLRFSKIKLGIAGMLLDRNIDIDSQNSRGQTALMLAVKNGRPGNLKMVDFLLQRGAKIDIRTDFDGNNAIMLAVGANRADILLLVLKHMFGDLYRLRTVCKTIRCLIQRRQILNLI